MKAQKSIRLGQYLALAELCTCTQTYSRWADSIEPFPNNLEETIPALQALCHYIIDPVIAQYGRARFELTYGFCSLDLKRFLAKRDPVTGLKNGKSTPSVDQHMAHEKNRNGRYYCDRLGAACDFRIVDLDSNALVEWILGQALPFDSLYYYGTNRPIHISYGPQHKRQIWAFTEHGTPTKKGVQHWQRQVQG
ncbi:hypothetical protein N836_03115 [Leptolyngbya sp. Heron Island J]|uniref:hypothetical protein n=1 Tax=Leptolyngbya sp. Heron Island J TaxID=1385935 RepID=UPI0003B9C448|nr:hypothetical protein [Leptolyngbya sp. Heron Island J]ESA37394.1 hypothetical protein N836_03115 [Leptolyngbya sp. Heron Island J]